MFFKGRRESSSKRKPRKLCLKLVFFESEIGKEKNKRPEFGLDRVVIEEVKPRTARFEGVTGAFPKISKQSDVQ